MKMIKDIPDGLDFIMLANRYLNLGWRSAFSILEDGDIANETEDAETIMGYWSAAEPELATALALVQQAAEFYLKARIASVSPWLLVRTEPKDFPKPKLGEAASFSEFRTLDAQDLIRVSNAVFDEILSEEFTREFDAKRAQRNAGTHSVGGKPTTALEIIRYALIISEPFIGERKWAQSRRDHLTRDRLYQTSFEWQVFTMAKEFERLTRDLTAGELKRFYGFEKKQRVYRCLNCHYETRDAAEDGWLTAQLIPNAPDSTNIHCYACGEDSEVIRKSCRQAPECKGNVISKEHQVCLTCLEDWVPEEDENSS